MLKAQNYFLAKYILKSLTHGKYKLPTSQEYFSQQNLWELCLFFHNQPTTKAHVYHPWQNSSFCRDIQAQRSSTTKPSPHTNPSSWRSCELTSQISAQLNSWCSFPSSSNLSNQIRRGHVSIRG